VVTLSRRLISAITLSAIIDLIRYEGTRSPCAPLSESNRLVEALNLIYRPKEILYPYILAFCSKLKEIVPDSALMRTQAHVLLPLKVRSSSSTKIGHTTHSKLSYQVVYSCVVVGFSYKGGKNTATNHELTLVMTSDVVLIDNQAVQHCVFQPHRNVCRVRQPKDKTETVIARVDMIFLWLGIRREESKKDNLYIHAPHLP